MRVENDLTTHSTLATAKRDTSLSWCYAACGYVKNLLLIYVRQSIHYVIEKLLV